MSSGPGPGTTPTPGDVERTGPPAAAVPLPAARAALWAMLGHPVKARALRLLVDEHGLDGWAAAAAVGHALRHEGSPWGVDVDQAVGRALGEALREAFAPARKAVELWAEHYRRNGAAIVASLAPVARQLQAAQRPRIPIWGARGLDGRVRR